ncbi:MAG: hypothetical protein U0872_02330 [Planctomycetaceae bacterium]
MIRKLLFGAVALAGLMIIPTQSADAGWRRAARRGYYYGPAARRYYRPYRQYYAAPPMVYGPGYSYGSPYGFSGYNYGYGPYGYGPGVGVTTPGFGFYVRRRIKSPTPSEERESRSLDFASGFSVAKDNGSKGRLRAVVFGDATTQVIPAVHQS